MKPWFCLPIVFCLMAAAAVGAGETSPSGEPWPKADVAKIQSARTGEELLRDAGPPSARYHYADAEYWLYANAVEESNGRRLCPEVMLRNGKIIQTNGLPEEIMIQSVAAAAKFKGWVPPVEIREKSFVLSDTQLVGKSREEVMARLGEPDFKRVFNGREVWEYKKVPIQKEAPDRITIDVEFQEDKVLQSSGH